jgi:maleylacetate reductase
VVAGASAARKAGADLLVAVGGGSVIDATKAMLLCLWEDLRTAEAMAPYLRGADNQRTANPGQIRMISVSTTLSASEFTTNAGVSDDATKAKQGVAHPLFVPRVAILDPAMLLATPVWLLGATGMRSVDHAVEGWCALAPSPFMEQHSMIGFTLLAGALAKIKDDPADLPALQQAQFGMWHAIAPVAAGAGTGASHGIGYALGAAYGVAHGHTSCVMLPAVLRWNEAVNADRQRYLAEAVGAPDEPLWELVLKLIKHLDQPASLRDLSIGRQDLPRLAASALGYAPVRANPRPIHGESDVMEILELAW